METLQAKPTFFSRGMGAILGIVWAVLLPQLFHMAGILTGTGSLPGTIFLPMHIAVFMTGLTYGMHIGLLVGVFSPLLSSFLSGMPALPMAGIMSVELAAYGLTCGILSKKKIPVLLKVFIAQLCGRIVKLFFLFIFNFVSNLTVFSFAEFFNSVLISVPGILLQLIALPLLCAITTRKRPSV